MTNSTCLLLKDILLKTFFDFAMFEILPYTGEKEPELTTSSIYSITTQTPERYRLNFSFSQEIQKKIVENIFEMSIEKMQKDQVNDCILEIVNIVAGNFFTAFFKKKAFKMGLPHIHTSPKKNPEKCECVLYFTIDNKLFKVELN